jgi:hypothetical protein
MAAGSRHIHQLFILEVSKDALAASHCGGYGAIVEAELDA